jgi:rhodanese-related sulfurtransferase
MKTLHYLLLFLGATSMFSQKTLEDVLEKYNTKSIPYISSKKLTKTQNNTAILFLDTREKKEYDVSHIKGATHVGYKTFDLAIISETIKDKDSPIIVYCSLGVRSEEIGEKLQKAGYTNIKNLYGGIFDWKNNGLPLVNNQQKETDSVHIYAEEWGEWLYKGVKVTNK